MVSQKLFDYVINAKQKNFSDDKIREILAFYNWRDNDINEALDEVARRKAASPSGIVVRGTVLVIGRVLNAIVQFFSDIFGPVFRFLFIDIPKIIFFPLIAFGLFLLFVAVDFVESFSFYVLQGGKKLTSKTFEKSFLVKETRDRYYASLWHRDRDRKKGSRAPAGQTPQEIITAESKRIVVHPVGRGAPESAPKHMVRGYASFRFWLIVTKEALRDLVTKFPAFFWQTAKETPSIVSEAFKNANAAITQGTGRISAYFALLVMPSLKSKDEWMRERELNARIRQLEQVLDDKPKKSVLSALSRFVVRLFAAKKRMTIGDSVLLSLRAFKTRGMRTSLTILGISVGIGAILFLVSLGYGLERVIFEKIATADALLSIDVVSPNMDLLPLSEKSIEDIKNIPGVVEIVPSLSISGEAHYQDFNSNILVNATTYSYFRLGGVKEADVGRLFAENEADSIVVTNEVVQLLNLSRPEDIIDQTMQFTFFVTQKNDKGIDELVAVKQEKDFKVVGVVESDNYGSVIMPIQAITGYDTTKYTQIKVKTENATVLKIVKDALAGKGFFVSALSDTIDQAAKIFRGIQIVLGLFGVIALTVSAIGMFNTMTIALLERTQEIGIMKALGASNGDIWFMFVMESFVIGLLGGVVGISMGLLLGEVFNAGINVLAQRLGGKALDIFYAPYWFIFTVMGFSSIVGFMTGLWPAKRAASLDTLKALKNK
jgi:putative ABC transport system permease protein